MKRWKNCIGFTHLSFEIIPEYTHLWSPSILIKFQKQTSQYSAVSILQCIFPHVNKFHQEQLTQLSVFSVIKKLKFTNESIRILLRAALVTSSFLNIS